MIVWIFTQLRSGSTAFTDLVHNHLHREHLFVNYENDYTNVLNISNPTDYLFSTHSFNFLEIMNTYTDPVLLIRCTRKNKAEQCLSHLLGNWMNDQVDNKDRFWNMKRNDSLNVNVNTFNQAEPTLITKKQVTDYIAYLRGIEDCWNSVASNYQNVTIFYEDLCSDGVDIPELGIKSLKISDTNSSTIKLPSYKENLCMNHTMVRRWVEEYYTN